MGNILRQRVAEYFPSVLPKSYGIDLTEAMVHKIHLLARDFGVAAMDNGMSSCADCRDALAKPAETQQKDDRVARAAVMDICTSCTCKKGAQMSRKPRPEEIFQLLKFLEFR